MPEPDDPNSRDLEPAFLLVRLAQVEAQGLGDASHGYALTKWLREQGFAPRAVGTMYRHLRRLEEDGLVTSVWEPSQTRGPRRRVYSLTPEGYVAIKEYAVALDTVVALVRRFKAHLRKL